MSALAAIIERSRANREDWRYTDLEKLLAAGKASKSASPLVREMAWPDASAPRVVFENGVWNEGKSRMGDLPKDCLRVEGEAYRLTFAAQSCMVAEPIDLVFLGGEKPVRLAIDIGANTSLSLVEHHQAVTDVVVHIDMALAPQAKLLHAKIMEGADAAHIAETRVAVAEGGYYRSFVMAKDTRLMRHELDIVLTGPLAQCGLYGAMLLQGREHADILTRVRHDAPNSSSRQLFKAILAGQARGVFQGRIAVAKGAQKIEGKQLCRALLLSDQAEMDAKPELEINADDVSCSHGCAVGDLDADAMFYLRARGLSKHEARGLLMQAFIGEVLDEIQGDALRAHMRGYAERWMHEQA